MKILFIKQYLYGDGNDPTKRDIWLIYDKENLYIINVLRYQYDANKIGGTYKCKRDDYIHRQINEIFYKIRDDPLTRKLKYEYKKSDWDLLCEQIKTNKFEETTPVTTQATEIMTKEDFVYLFDSIKEFIEDD